MTDPRAPIFAAVRAAAPAGVFNDPMNVAALDNLLDAFGVARAGAGDSAAKHVLHDAPAFFAAVRKITGPLDQVQVDTVNRLLAAAAHWPASWLAYGFATAWHEARLKPIEEIGKGKGRKYGAPGKHGGQIAYGRGLVQLTWDFNYAAADEGLGLGGKLIADYSLALDPDIATRILVWGMERGKFTGKSLDTYLDTGPGTYAEFVDCRRIINGTDRADMIAGYALSFQQALDAGGWA